MEKKLEKTRQGKEEPEELETTEKQVKEENCREIQGRYKKEKAMGRHR